MMNNPLVSVIVPNYNHAKYLDERIQSVLNQTYQNFELIILDDCSSDDGASKAVIERYRGNPHVSLIIYNEVNSGSTFKQWNKGMELAKGELIWIAESDDKCESTLLDTLVGQFQKDSNCVLAYCISILFNDAGEIIGQSGKPGCDLGMTGIDFIRNHMCIGNAIWNASSALFKREIALGIDKQYTAFRGAGDRLFWVEIAERGNVAIANKPLNLFRQHSDNSTKNNYENGINQKEDKIILDNIYRRGYISLYEYNIAKDKYANLHVFHYKDFKNDQIRDELMRLWKLSFFDRLYDYMYRRFVI